MMINPNEMRQQLKRLSNEELISILLRRDENEWQPEIIEIVGEILSERGLAAGRSVKYTVGPQSALDETEGLMLKTIAEYMSRLDAEADRLILEGEGVQAWIFEDDSVPPEGIPGIVQLKVCAEDWRAAMERLQPEDMPSSDLPVDIAEFPCPKCLSRRVIESGESPELHHYCASCGHEWTEMK